MADLIPPAGEKDVGRVLAWALDALSEGEAFLKGQQGFEHITDLMDAVMGDYSRDPVPMSLSQVNLNWLAKNFVDNNAGLTDIKPFWEYRTFNKLYDRQADGFGKLSQQWWTNRLIDLRFADAVSYGQVGGSGYCHLVYNREINDLDMVAEDPRDVLPVRPWDNISIQHCMAVIIRRERTVNYVRDQGARGVWQNTSLVVADREGSLAAMQRNTRAQKLMNMMGLQSGFLTNLFSQTKGSAQAHLNVPTVDVFTIYCRDDARNNSTLPILMGDPSQNWSYIVNPGEMLYPRHRCIIFTRTAVLYDGPNIYWHGLFPIFKLTLDAVPWSWLGKPTLADILPLQMELNRLMKVVSDHNQRVARPGAVADKNSMSRAAFDKIDTRRAGLKARLNPVAGKPFEIVHELPLDPSIQLTITFLQDMMDKLSGSKDISQLANLNQLPSAESIEKMLESMSPSIRLRSRRIEAFMREFAHALASNFLQFYTTAQRIAVLGDDGLTFEDFDFDPGSMIPDFLGDDLDDQGKPKNESMQRGPRPRSERAREFLRFFTYHIAPSSLLAASEVTKKLLYIQLSRAGLIDIWTLFDVLGIPNVGLPPGGASTIPERLAAMQQMGIGQQVSSTGRKASAEKMPQMSSTGIRES